MFSDANSSATNDANEVYIEWPNERILNVQAMFQRNPLPFGDNWKSKLNDYRWYHFNPVGNASTRFKASMRNWNVTKDNMPSCYKEALAEWNDMFNYDGDETVQAVVLINFLLEHTPNSERIPYIAEQYGVEPHLTVPPTLAELALDYQEYPKIAEFHQFLIENNPQLDIHKNSKYGHLVFPPTDVSLMFSVVTQCLKNIYFDSLKGTQRAS